MASPNNQLANTRALPSKVFGRARGVASLRRLCYHVGGWHIRGKKRPNPRWCVLKLSTANWSRRESGRGKGQAAAHPSTQSSQTRVRHPSLFF
jgi:hypothetical protein